MGDAAGEADAAHRLVVAAWSANRASVALAAALIRSHATRGELDEAGRVLGAFTQYREEADPQDAADLQEAMDLLKALHRSRSG